MPIEVSTAIQVLDQDQFHALHHRLMGIIFQVHNEFGRLLDELLFKREIAARCEETGLSPTQREVRIRVIHESFSKDYFLDLLVCHGLPVEAKAVESFAPSHRAQALNYLLLTGLQHGTLLNLRSERVQQEFLSTKLTPEKRRVFTVVENGWNSSDERSTLLKRKMIELLQDWGAFLEIGLYKEALTHFLGGPQSVCARVQVNSGSRFLGEQNVDLLDPLTAFAITAVTGDTSRVRDHYERFIRHTPLQALHWINLNHHQIEFSTVTR
jgi:GxxExxY protein